MRADAAIEIIGVSASATTSTIASELGVIVEPTITSTLSSLMSLRVLVTARVVSDASSSTIQLTFSPPIVAGSSSIVFFSGMPSDAAGPVADSVTPIVMSAMADVREARQRAPLRARHAMTVGSSVSPDRKWRAAASNRRAPGYEVQRFTRIADLAQQQHFLGRRGVAAAGASRFSRLICLTIRKMMNARIMKLIATVMKLPYANSGTPAFVSASYVIGPL